MQAVVYQRPKWLHYFHTTVTSYWARWRLKSPASRLFTQPFVQVPVKENIKAPSHRPLRGIYRWPVNSLHTGSVTQKCFLLMSSSCSQSISGYPFVTTLTVCKIIIVMFSLVLTWTSCWKSIGWPVIWDAMTVIWRYNKHLEWYIRKT